MTQERIAYTELLRMGIRFSGLLRGSQGISLRLASSARRRGARAKPRIQPEPPDWLKVFENIADREEAAQYEIKTPPDFLKVFEDIADREEEAQYVG